MNQESLMRGSVQCQLVSCAILALLLCSGLNRASAAGDEPSKEDQSKSEPSFFFSIPEAKDCAFDQSRERLYVTTPKQLVILDTKKRQIIESIDLPGNLQGCDLSPDFKFLVIAPISAQYLYRVGLDWEKVEDLEVSQIKFSASSSETGVFSICVGSDNSVIFTTTYSGSGGVKLRRLDPQEDKVEVIQGTNMDTVLAPSGDRRFAAAGQGNISSGPIGVYDFEEKTLTHIVNTESFIYELACANEAKYIARPHRTGCDLYDGKGVRLGTLEGASVIAAVFHPKNDNLFLMRHGELAIQEYDVQGMSVSSDYPLDKPLVIKGDVHVSGILNLQPVGRERVIGHYSTIRNVNFHTYKSGRLKISEDGKSLFAVIPTGVYMFPVQSKPKAETGTKPKVKIKVIDATE